MRLRLDRWPPSTAGITFGSIRVRDTSRKPWEWFCYSQEKGKPRTDSLFIPGESTIPAGRYNVQLVESKRFGLAKIPMLYCIGASDGTRTHIATYFHPGHHVADVEGCIAIGLEHDGPRVRKTKAAFEALLSKLVIAIEHGNAVDLEIA